MQKVIDEQGLPDVVFHSLRHTSVTYKLKLSGGDIKAVQGDSGHAQADMVTEVYGHIIDEDRRKNAQRMEDAFYNRENLNPQMKGADAGQTANTVTVPEGVDADLLMKVLGNPEMAALLTSLAKSLKAESKYNNGNRTESTGIRRNPDVGGLFLMENNVHKIYLKL